MTYFGPALDPPLGGSGQKTTTLVRDLKYFIHTKFHQNPSSGSGEEVKNVNCLTDDRRQTTDAGQRVITIGHWSLWLLCPKKVLLLIYNTNVYMMHYKLHHIKLFSIKSKNYAHIFIPAVSTWPRMTSDTSSAPIQALERASLIHADPRSCAGIVDKLPLKLPGINVAMEYICIQIL